MHIPPRADALDNLLSHVAPFVEIKRARLFRLLRQITFADIDSVTRNARHNALHLYRFRTNRSRSRGHQCVPQLLYESWCNP